MPRRRPDMHADARWHLDKRVPIALILAVIGQTVAVSWWASSVTERLNALERTAAIVSPQSDRLTRLEVQLEFVKDAVSRIERALTVRPPASSPTSL